MTKKSLKTALNELAGKEYSFLKTKLSDVLISEIVPIGKQIKKLSAFHSRTNALRLWKMFTLQKFVNSLK